MFFPLKHTAYTINSVSSIIKKNNKTSSKFFSWLWYRSSHPGIYCIDTAFDIQKFGSQIHGLDGESVFLLQGGRVYFSISSLTFDFPCIVSGLLMTSDCFLISSFSFSFLRHFPPRPLYSFWSSSSLMDIFQEPCLLLCVCLHLHCLNYVWLPFVCIHVICKRRKRITHTHGWVYRERDGEKLSSRTLCHVTSFSEWEIHPLTTS